AAPRSAREAKPPRRCEGAERPPLAEDECGQSDEPAAAGDVLVERVDEAQREIDAAERGEPTGHGNGRITRRINGDSDRVGRSRMFSNRAQAKTDGSPEHHEPRDDQKDEAEPDHKIEASEDIVEKMAQG